MDEEKLIILLFLIPISILIDGLYLEIRRILTKNNEKTRKKCQ